MHAETEFYQISGFRAHSNGWYQYDDKPMIDALASDTSKLLRPGGPDSPIELVLGILPSGASYLLMTTEQMLSFTHKYRLSTPRNPWKATEFLSLSPIYFHSAQELSAKLATYKQRPRNKNRREVEEPQDNSQANRGYVRTNVQVMHHRAYFENQRYVGTHIYSVLRRALYRLLTKSTLPGKIGLSEPSWLGAVRVVSIVFGEWTVDNRRRDERLDKPRLVEVGWTDTSFPDFFDERAAKSTVHLKLTTPSKMANPVARAPHFSEVVEGDEAELYSRLRTLLSAEANNNGIPLIVLVHDEVMARGILARAGANVDSYQSGLAKLLPLPSVVVSAVPANH
ncbi:hypothetical protein HYDPIDRAFT_84951 [Hydnomerulius pinastri MD-312]|nr:hypothetical protein HYDPIDRAFT_84951 [Hydnomerulius pinastri MD-312]